MLKHNLLSLLLIIGLISCNKSKDADTQTASVSSESMAVTQSKAIQSGTMPDQALKNLKDGNDRFVEGRMLKRNLLKQVQETKEGQFPFATIVSCMDSRTSSEIIFDQGIGDVFNLRVAGNICNVDVLGSLEYGAKVAGAKLIAVIGHSHCGAVKGACDDVKIGNIGDLVSKIRPIVLSTSDDGKGKNSKNHHFVEEVAKGNVLQTMKSIREGSPLLAEMIDRGEIALVGGMYDIETGKVEFYDGSEVSKKH